jgi:uncharacterized membrane protein
MTDVTPPAQTTFSRFRRWLVPVLVVSLSMNLLVAGFMLGHAVMARHRGFGGPQLTGPVGPIGRFIGDLPRDRRAAVQGLFDEQRKVLAGLTPAVRTARRDLDAALQGTPFDRAKLETALRALSDAEHTLRTGSASSTSLLVEKLSDDERRRLQHMLRRIMGSLDDGREPQPNP